MENRRSKRFDVPAKVVAAELNVSLRTIQRMCKKGELRAMKVRGQWRIREDWRSQLEARADRN
jgi:excisionase family DNA binding protein